MKYNIIALLVFLCLLSTFARSEEIYRMPPKEIVDILDAPVLPSVDVSPDRHWMLLKEYPPLIPMAELVQPELRLAGLIINPKNNGTSRITYYNKFHLKKVADGTDLKITGLPDDMKASNIKWSPDSKYIAFTMITKRALNLWIIDVSSGKAGKVLDQGLNDAYGTAFNWLDGKSLICKIVPSDRGPVPEPPEVPSGPVVQENTGKKSPSRTLQDLLENPYDEKLFEYYLNSQIVLVTPDGKWRNIGSSGLLGNVKPSPDGKYLLVETIKRPFSYIVSVERFPKVMQIWDLKGQVIREIADLPLREDIPISFDAVSKGPRSVNWREDKPASLYWVEAQDGGDPAVKSEIRDSMFVLEAPFTGKPETLISLAMRFNQVMWCNDNLAMIWEYWKKNRTMHVWTVKPGMPQEKPELLFNYSPDDRYSDPGKPRTKPTAFGTYVMITTDDGSIYLSGDGASPEGDRPFLDKFNLTTGKKERLWQSKAPYYERIIMFLDDKKLISLFQRESVTEPPNYFIFDFPENKLRQITSFTHPAPELKNVDKKLIRYKRNDGVELTGTLYLPPGYKSSDGPLPMLMWAYPHEFKSADAAGQVTTSPYKFIRMYYGSPLLWLTRGYAVLDNPSMPIVGEGDEEPNDTYIKQLIASAEAAVNEVVKIGVADPKRIAIGGHSYGAFMTANLLAHTDLFCAGIARSGAYNRTLTPFGFQGEERTFWEAPDVYFSMSPFVYADKINEPILIIHGEMDNNPGTFPIQSERLSDAIKGLGGTVKLVILPYESHTYKARESALHMIWETDQWLEKYVKNKK